jgi:hypothetical protein
MSPLRQLAGDWAFAAMVQPLLVAPLSVGLGLVLLAQSAQITDPNLLSLLIQVPLVGAFGWFTLKQNDRYLRAMDQRDQVFMEYMDKVETRTLDSMKSSTEAIQELTRQVQSNSGVIISHDSRVGEYLLESTKLNREALEILQEERDRLLKIAEGKIKGGPN